MARHHDPFFTKILWLLHIWMDNGLLVYTKSRFVRQTASEDVVTAPESSVGVHYPSA